MSPVAESTAETITKTSKKNKTQVLDSTYTPETAGEPVDEMEEDSEIADDDEVAAETPKVATETAKKTKKVVEEVAVTEDKKKKKTKKVTEEVTKDKKKVGRAPLRITNRPLMTQEQKDLMKKNSAALRVIRNQERERILESNNLEKIMKAFPKYRLSPDTVRDMALFVGIKESTPEARSEISSIINKLVRNLTLASFGFQYGEGKKSMNRSHVASALRSIKLSRFLY